MKPTAATIDEYILQYPSKVQERMNALRAAIREAAPAAGEKKHIGFHPAPSAIEAFKAELTDYHTSKGTVQFPYEKLLPYHRDHQRDS